jgi:VanZ family protein
MSFIFWMSTDTFSSEQTSQIIGPLLQFLFPSLAGQHIDFIHAVIRKLGHVSEYFILGILLFRAIRAESRQKWRPGWALAVVFFVVIFAASDEWHQSFTLTRAPSMIDVGFDSAGGVLSQVAILFKNNRRRIARILGYDGRLV